MSRGCTHPLALAAFLSLVITCFILNCISPSYSQGKIDGDSKVLLQLVDSKNVSFPPSSKAAGILERIRHSPETISYDIVRTRLDALDDKGILAAHLTKGTVINMPGATKANGGVGGKAVLLNWKGDRVTEAAYLILRENMTTGLIYTRGKVYAVEPLNEELQLVRQIDQSKIPEHRDNAERPLRNDGPNPNAPIPAGNAPPIEITLLVAYTQKVDASVASIDALIDSCIKTANDSFKNSGVSIVLRLVHAVKVNYVESGSIRTDAELFCGKGDKQMDEIHGLRDRSKADICVLLVDDKAGGSWSIDVLAKQDTAFSAVHFGYAVTNLSFAHEIGHLLGARHDIATDATMDRFGFNHGYVSTTSNWRTLMAYPTAMCPNRIPYWSNPDIIRDKEPMGSAKANNTLMLNKTADQVSKFR